ncbi:MAG: DUF202 domain-containing protein [Candidatus Aminicenantes bacterium]|nr:DUF202 domain-containing protein [Candidatus Aminicenantes bacterium]
MNGDELSVIRSHLANERTFLAYVRTSLAFLAAGAGMIHFFDSRLVQKAGWLILAAGSVIAITGFVRFVTVRRRILKSRPREPEKTQARPPHS